MAQSLRPRAYPLHRRLRLWRLTNFGRLRGILDASRSSQGFPEPALHDIEKTLLALPLEQRVMLAESLLSSVPPVGEEWSEAQELADAERRDREIESGQVRALDQAEFWQRVEARGQP
jgi:hypothetical protein